MIPLTTIILGTDNPALAASVAALVPAVEVIATTEPGDLGPLRAGEVRCCVEWTLRDKSGLELVRLFRTADVTAAAHITLALEDYDAETRSRALKAGADDYLPGPLSAAQIVQRLDRYSNVPRPTYPRERLRAGALELDPSAHRLFFQGNPIELRPRQFALMSFLMRHPDRVHSRSELLRALGSSDDERTVDAWVARLRYDLRSSGAPDALRTVRDYGYVLDTL